MASHPEPVRYALDAAGNMTIATPGGRGFCCGCGAPVIAKCGEIVVHHWAHESGQSCDAESRDESAWHLEWKALWGKECQEIAMGAHRADVAVGSWVVELQHSAIEPEEIRKREAFYVETRGLHMAWVFDTRDPYRHNRLRLRDEGPDTTFFWFNPRRGPSFCRQTVYLNYDARRLLRVHKWNEGDGYANGWGRRAEAADLLAMTTPAVATPTSEPLQTGFGW